MSQNNIEELWFQNWRNFWEIKRKNCFGCVHDCPSQKDHECMQNDFDMYYLHEAAQFLLNNQQISQEMFNNYIKENIPSVYFIPPSN